MLTTQKQLLSRQAFKQHERTVTTFAVPVEILRKVKETMTQLTQPTSRKATFGSRIMTTALLAFVIALLSSPAHAQWATSGTNINNTNTGNVGIGTTSPSASVHIKKVFTSAYGQLVLQDPNANDATLTSYMSFYGSSSRRGALGFARFAGASDPNLYFANEQTS